MVQTVFVGFATLAVLFFTEAKGVAASYEELADDVPFEQQLHVGGSEVSLAIPDAGVTLRVGQRMDLFQQTRDLYIGVVKVGNQTRFCCVPILDSKGRANAWVTNEKRVILSRSARTVGGTFFLLRGERLPVVEDGANAYRVLISRNGHQIVMALPKRLAGVALHTPEPGKHASPETVRHPRPQPPTTSPVSTGGGPSIVNPRPATVSSNTADETKSPQVAVTDAGRDEDGADPPLPSASGGGQSVKTPTPGRNWDFSRFSQVAGFLDSHALILQIVLLVCIVEGLLLARMRREKKVVPAAGAKKETEEVRSSVVAVSYGESVAHSVVEDIQVGHELAGSLADFSIHNVIQLISTQEESGNLWVSFGDGSPMQKLVFNHGHLVHAVGRRGRKGMDVLRSVLACEQGSFSFKQGDTTEEEITLSGDTMGLLLEAARQHDERDEAASNSSSRPKLSVARR